LDLKDVNQMIFHKAIDTGFLVYSFSSCLVLPGWKSDFIGYFQPIPRP